MTGGRKWSLLVGMKDDAQDMAGRGDAVSREEFEQFLHGLTHEIRNRLNGIALEAADLAEQAGSHADAARLQQQVQDCAAFLKKVRAALAPEESQAARLELAEFMKKLKERSF